LSFAAVSSAALVSAVKASQIRESQVTNTKTLDTTQRTLDAVLDCTTPGRKCFDRGQKQTADAVADINKVAVLAAACADEPGVQGRDEIFACVVQQLGEEE
jgi:hypothetical protein